ncbi:tRNA preQ1(34) S-adenosylmethionine ribosyltransferase-isomerase QueA [Suttonella sp. R2A3]|uniref:tRNA preQ1(34) S-adenosylmethionine ribosyltransferase-isomerase QueA n=1 Tax=Suttonella sp. R2A3 TaxID=2908648 RepID=UPI0038FBE632
MYKKSDFHFDLPEGLIARYPLDNRSDSRLLVVEPQADEHAKLSDHGMRDWLDTIGDDDLLVLNNTRVLPARLHGQKASGGKVEILIERLKSAHEARAYLRASKSPKEGSQLFIGDDRITVSGRDNTLFTLTSEKPWQALMAAHGEMPIPPYLERDADALDSERYQTVYAQHPGAVAAPTAGLHIDQTMLETIAARGIACTQVTLHVGAGTFQPVREEDLSAHVMHEEWLSVDQSAVDAIKACRARGGRVIAVGTTSLRALESAARDGELVPFEGDTNLFITPGYSFNCVDALLTNFHLPESTLLMLVSAFAGYNAIREAYQHAIDAQYRFFSYGDAMFINHRCDVVAKS